MCHGCNLRLRSGFGVCSPIGSFTFRCLNVQTVILVKEKQMAWWVLVVQKAKNHRRQATSQIYRRAHDHGVEK